MDTELSERLPDLRPSADASWGLAAGAAAILAGVAVRSLMKQGWRTVRHEEVPNNPASSDVAWGEALTWAALSGVAVAVARLVARRGVAGLWEGRGRSPAERWTRG